ncbi:MAG: NUDIX domain-containing protein [Rhodoferax sp.]|nr:NUDIX domain-containing protein [Rhodoferax sp.]
MREPLLADPQLARGGSRDLVEVAVGVLIRPDGAFLLTSRPAGKVYAGYWEFPGGKLEPGESVATALRRELQEELDISVHQAFPWRDTLVDYPHALVRLNFCKVFTWDGHLRMREGQMSSWQQLPVSVVPVLPGTIPVLSMLADERHFLAPTHQ